MEYRTQGPGVLCFMKKAYVENLVSDSFSGWENLHQYRKGRVMIAKQKPEFFSISL